MEKEVAMRRRSTTKVRLGVVAPLLALLMVPLLAMVAFSVDTGYMVEVRAELQRTADAAALAGIQQLYASYGSWKSANTASQITIANQAISNAKTTASAVAQLNKAGNVAIQLLSSDLDVGYTDSNNKYYSGASIPTGKYPNTVHVTARRDNTSLPTSNGELKLFFGGVVGMKSVALTTYASAIAYEGMITNFKSSLGINGSLLPVAVDATQWTSFYQLGALSPYTDPNATTGSAWLQIYPGGTGSSMDGLLSLNGSKAASNGYYSGTTGWIEGGPTSSDISSLQSAGDLPLPTDLSGETWASGPGMKSDLLTDFQALITTPQTMRLLPLFDPNSTGTTGGGNGTYQIVAFVPVYVVYAQGHGKANMDIAVVPAGGSVVTDPTAVVTNQAPLSSSSTPAQYLVPVSGRLAQ
jgi:Flp pilus assembly protein TadG